MLTRRRFLASGIALGSGSIVTAAAADGAPAAWNVLRHGLMAAEAQVKRLGWTLTPLTVQPPASPAAIAKVEALYGVKIPPQLRDMLLRCSADVSFGWSTPPLLQALDGLRFPTSGGFSGKVWSLDQLDGPALEGFRGLNLDVADDRDDVQLDPPDLWKHQFPWIVPPTDDILTLDVSVPGGPHPVRYFSTERGILHGHVIAPDFLSFLSTYVAPGCAGGGIDEWFRFIALRDDGSTLIDAESEGGRRWQAWFRRDPDHRGPNDPPPSVAAKTRSDFDLLETAQAGSAWGVSLNLAAGATPDCVDARDGTAGGSYGVSFETAVVYAIRRGDVALVEQLLAAGAALDTRRLALTEAFAHASADTAHWVLTHGGRCNGWTDDRVSPLHALLVAYGDDAKLNETERLALLKVLLKNGVDPNTRGESSRTVLMTADPETATILLAHGADPKLFDVDGDTALHLARDPASVELLLRHGADVNGMTRPPAIFGLVTRDAPHTPVQERLRAADGPMVAALRSSGADLRKRDGAGRSTLWYCRTPTDADMCIALGCDPLERDGRGATLLHNVVESFGDNFAASETGPPLFDDLQKRGIDINAVRRDGKTVLHLMAMAGGNKDSVKMLLDRGADRTLRDAAGRLAGDLLPRSHKETQALLLP